MRRTMFIVCAILLCAAVITPVVHADRRTRAEVQELVNNVEAKIEKYRDSGADKIAGREISQIELHLKNARAHLDERDWDYAYYEAGKADAYFMLIDAKKDLESARKEFNASNR